MHILWSEQPTDEDRMNAIKHLNGEIIDFHPYEVEEWSESYITDGIKLEISSFLMETVKRVIDEVVINFDTAYDKQCLVAAVSYGVVLYGEENVKEMKQKASSYPAELSKQMVLENLELGNRWNNRRALLDRKDWLMLYDVICSVERRVLGILFGLNRIYVHHPAFKWLKQSAELMEIKPPQVYERLTDILVGDTASSVEKLELLIQDVYELLETHYPDLDIEPYKARAEFVRPKQP